MSVLSAESGNYTCVANVLFPYVNTGINLIVTNTTFLTVTSKYCEKDGMQGGSEEAEREREETLERRRQSNGIIIVCITLLVWFKE